jgi:hypothetical protein
MQIAANSPDEYLQLIPDDRKPAMNLLRQTILANLPKGFEETMSYGMIGYVVPHSVYPSGYHCDPKLPLPFLAIASQNNWFLTEYSKYSKLKLDMGKSCTRFKKSADIPFELIGNLVQKISVEKWIEIYESKIKNKK